MKILAENVEKYPLVPFWLYLSDDLPEECVTTKRSYIKKLAKGSDVWAPFVPNLTLLKKESKLEDLLVPGRDRFLNSGTFNTLLFSEWMPIIEALNELFSLASFYAPTYSAVNFYKRFSYASYCSVAESTWSSASYEKVYKGLSDTFGELSPAILPPPDCLSRVPSSLDEALIIFRSPRFKWPSFHYTINKDNLYDGTRYSIPRLPLTLSYYHFFDYSSFKYTYANKYTYAVWEYTRKWFSGYLVCPFNWLLILLYLDQKRWYADVDFSSVGIPESDLLDGPFLSNRDIFLSNLDLPPSTDFETIFSNPFDKSCFTSSVVTYEYTQRDTYDENDPPYRECIMGGGCSPSLKSIALNEVYEEKEKIEDSPLIPLHTKDVFSKWGGQKYADDKKSFPINELKDFLFSQVFLETNQKFYDIEPALRSIISAPATDPGNPDGNNTDGNNTDGDLTEGINPDGNTTEGCASALRLPLKNDWPSAFKNWFSCVKHYRIDRFDTIKTPPSFSATSYYVYDSITTEHTDTFPFSFSTFGVTYDKYRDGDFPKDSGASEDFSTWKKNFDVTVNGDPEIVLAIPVKLLPFYFKGNKTATFKDSFGALLSSAKTDVEKTASDRLAYWKDQLSKRKKAVEDAKKNGDQPLHPLETLVDEAQFEVDNDKALKTLIDSLHEYLTSLKETNPLSVSPFSFVKPRSISFLYPRIITSLEYYEDFTFYKDVKFRVHDYVVGHRDYFYEAWAGVLSRVILKRTDSTSYVIDDAKNKTIRVPVHYVDEGFLLTIPFAGFALSSEDAKDASKIFQDWSDLNLKEEAGATPPSPLLIFKGSAKSLIPLYSKLGEAALSHQADFTTEGAAEGEYGHSEANSVTTSTAEGPFVTFDFDIVFDQSGGSGGQG